MWFPKGNNKLMTDKIMPGQRSELNGLTSRSDDCSLDSKPAAYCQYRRCLPVYQIRSLENSEISDCVTHLVINSQVFWWCLLLLVFPLLPPCNEQQMTFVAEHLFFWGVLLLSSVCQEY